MKRQIRLSFISILIFLSILASLLFIARPIIQEAKKQMQIIENHYILLVSEKTGIRISYESLSPSILSGLRLSSIGLYDKETEKQIAEIDSIKLSWNLFKMLDGDISDAFGNLVVSGIFINYNDLENELVRQKLLTLFKTFSDTRADSKKGFSIPFDIKIRNSAIVYADKNINLTFRLSQLTLSVQNNTKLLTVDSRGSLRLTFLHGKATSLGTIELNYLFQGGFPPKLTNSYAQLSFHDMDSALFSVSRLDFNTTFDGTTVTIGMIENGMPFEIMGTYNTLEHKVAVQLKAEQLEPFSLINLKKTYKVNLSNFYHTKISGIYLFSYEFDKEEFNYVVKGSLDFPDAVISGGATLKMDLNGDAQNIYIANLGISSNIADASFEGSFNIPQLLPQGVASIKKLRLPSGNQLATEMYISPVKNGFLCFIPKLSFGSTSLTALQLSIIPQNNSVDFSFEAYDYSHIKDSETGKITFSGSYEYSGGSFIQTQLSTENFFVDTVLAIVEWSIPVVKASGIESLRTALSNYIFTFDIFVSSDLKHVTYNIPYFFAANTKKENEMLLLSCDGTEELLRLSQFEFLFGAQKLTANLNADFSDISDIFFSSEVNLNSIPYNFSGVYTNTNEVKISGDYDLSADIKFASNEIFNKKTVANISMVSLPIIFNEYSFLLGLDTHFEKTGSEWTCYLNDLLIQDTSEKIESDPRLQISGTLNNYGFTSSLFVFNDTVSTLEGSFGAGWNFSNGILHSAFVTILAGENLSPESVNLSIEASNPESIKLQSPGFIKNLFFNATGSIQELQFGHFMNNQKSEDVLNCTINALGSVDTPSVQITVNSGQLNLGGNSLLFSGVASLQDKDITIENGKATYGSYRATDISTKFNLDNISGTANAKLSGELDKKGHYSKKHFETPVSLSFMSEATENKFSVDLIFQKVTGNFFTERDSVPAHLEKTPNLTSFYVGSQHAFEGTISSTGEIHVLATKAAPISFECEGILQKSGMYLMIKDIYMNADHFRSILDMDKFTLINGEVTGEITASGSLKNPQFNGQLTGINAVATVPFCTNENMYTDLINCSIQNSKFSLDKVLLTGEDSKGQFILNYSIDISNFATILQHVDITSVDNKPINAHLAFPLGVVSGSTLMGLDIDIEPSLSIIKGTVDVTNLESIFSSFTIEKDKKNLSDANPNSYTETIVDITVNIGQKSQVYFPSKDNPMIRGLVGQEKPIHFTMDTASNSYTLTGDLTVRGGEILYINRTFYLREGKVSLNTNQDLFDPIISIRAEIRETDDEGDLIKIILTATDQHLSSFSPTLTSSPTKSKTEIMSLLGQAVFGDVTTSSNVFGDVLAGVLDYGLQIGVFRHAENALRDFFNFDIFSFRTTFIQNAMSQAIDSTTSDDSEDDVTFGNYLDGSTVYIGKYIGDTLYADMMLELVYDDTLDDSKTLDGLYFKPEIGFELPSPFATIRWSIAPDVTSDWNLLVPYTSISLSWKFML
jgi:hypothetical protein